MSAHHPYFVRLGKEPYHETTCHSMPTLRPEQQARLRATLAPPNGPPPVGSPIQPLKPNLPTSPLAAGERLIALGVSAPQPASARSRRAAASAPQLTEDQKILQLLN